MGSHLLWHMYNPHQLGVSLPTQYYTLYAQMHEAINQTFVDVNLKVNKMPSALSSVLSQLCNTRVWHSSLFAWYWAKCTLTILSVMDEDYISSIICQIFTPVPNCTA